MHDEENCEEYVNFVHVLLEFYTRIILKLLTVLRSLK